MQEVDYHDMWFQQNSAKCQTACITIDLLRGEFVEHFILRSCDLMPLDYIRHSICVAILKLMSIQASSLQLRHWKTTLKYLFMSFRPKRWKEYAKI